MKTVTVRFLQPYTVKDGRVGTPEEATYSLGDVVEMEEPSSAHFIARGLAEVHKEVKKRRAKPDESIKAEILKAKEPASEPE